MAMMIKKYFWIIVSVSILLGSAIVSGFISKIPDYPFNGQPEIIIELDDNSYIYGGSFSGGILKTDFLGEVIPEFFESWTLGGFDLPVATIFNDKTSRTLFVGGKFNSFNEKISNRITALDYDGQAIQSFIDNIGQGFDGDVLFIGEVNENQIIVSGNFENFNLMTTGNVVLLNKDGTLDENFPKEIIQNSRVEFVKIDKTRNKLLVGGDIKQSSNRTALVEIDLPTY